MGKIETLGSYIYRCDEIITSKDIHNAEKLQAEIIGVYSSEIQNITESLDNYSPGMMDRRVDYIGDLVILRAKLINYKDNLENMEKRYQFELERLKAQNAVYNFSNNLTNTNENSSISNATASNNIEVAYSQVIESIHHIPSSVLSDEAKEELEEKIAALDAAMRSKDKTRIFSKIKNILAYIGDKAIDVGITVLPYLGLIAQYAPALA